jgi:type I restriction enzyme S subunit
MSNNWPLVTLGDVLELVSRPEAVRADKTYQVLGAHWYAKGLYTKAVLSGSEIRASRIYRVEKGDFVYNRLFGWKGSFAIAAGENHNCYVSNEFPCFLVDKEKLEGRYLWYYFSRESVWLEALGLSSGGTPTSRNRLKQEKLLAMEIPLPPLDEQRRIVARIEELAAKVEQAQELRRQSVAKVEALPHSVAKNLFDCSGVKTTVNEFASVLGGYAFRSTYYDENGSHQIVRIGNVRDGYLDLSRAPVRWDYQNEDRLRKYELQEGDILISMTGTRNKRDYGYIAIVPPGKKLLLNQRVGKITLHAGEIDHRYFFHFLRSPFFRDNLFPKAKGTANQANIGNKHILSVPFEYPPLSEQRRIVAYLDSLQAKVEAVKRHQAATAANLEALLPSILDKAFKGEL